MMLILIFKDLFYVYEWLAYIYEHYMCFWCLQKSKEGIRAPVLGPEQRSSVRAKTAPNHGAITPALLNDIFCQDSANTCFHE